MDRKEIIKNFRRYVDLSDEQADLFFKYAERKSLKKNDMLVRQGEDQCPLVLIKSGCLMTYHTNKNKTEHVMQFGIEAWWTGDLGGFPQKRLSEYSIKAMDATEVYLLNFNEFEALMRQASCFERYFRILFQNSLVSHQKRIIRNISFTAEEKYKAFTDSYPGIELIVPQKYIASYLGITPEFLSKIRRRLAGR